MKFKVGDKVKTYKGQIVTITRDETGPASMYEGWFTVLYSDGFSQSIHEAEMRPAYDPNEIIKELL